MERKNAEKLYNDMIEYCKDRNWTIPDYVIDDINEHDPEDEFLGFYEHAVICLVGWICLGSNGDGSGGYEEGQMFLDEVGASAEDKEYYMESACDWYF